jgi:ribosome-binding protein aMBF1 (putative translation factor)
MAGKTDFLDELIDERAAANPAFAGMVEAAYERRRLLRALAKRREELGLSQTQVAARMGTSQSSVARLESGEADARLSTIERFSAALGVRLNWSFDDAPSASHR